MKNFLAGALVVLAVIYFICPVDLMIGPVDDLVFLVLSIVNNNRVKSKQIAGEDE
jgi:hypothetical protein